MGLHHDSEQNTFRDRRAMLGSMARGWESKSVEAQQEEATRHRSFTRPLSAEERVSADRRRTLELARSRAAADLDRATAPAHRRMLESALQALDEQIRTLGQV
jgi:hypothetical protein